MIAKELKAIISPEEELLIRKPLTTNLTAYDFFQRGRDEYTKYLLGGNRNHLKNAISYYKLALRNDSAFAQAYIGLARARFNSYRSNVSDRLTFSENELKTVNDSTLSLVNKALTLDKNLDEAYMVRGWCSVDDKQALKEFRKALEINPNNSMAYYNISNIFFYSKEEVLEGIRYLIKAIELEKGPFLPRYLWSLGQWYEGFGFNANALDIYKQTFQLTKDTLQFYRDMSGPYYIEKNWKESIRWAKKILGKDPQNHWAHGQLAAIYTYVGKIDSAAYHLKNLIELDSTSFTGKFNKGTLYWLTGNDKEAKLIFNALSKFLQQLIKTGINSGFDVYSLAIIYSIEGDKNKAFEYLKMVNKSIRTENWCMMDMELNPAFKNIRPEPQFQEMLRESKSNWQEAHDQIYTWLKENNLLKI